MATSSEAKTFLTVDDVANRLNMDRKTIYDAIARKEIPALRVGRLLRVPGAWLREAAGVAEADHLAAAPGGEVG